MTDMPLLLKKCGRCLSAAYCRCAPALLLVVCAVFLGVVVWLSACVCSPACQKQHWKVHKNDCKKDDSEAPDSKDKDKDREKDKDSDTARASTTSSAAEEATPATSASTETKAAPAPAKKTNVVWTDT